MKQERARAEERFAANDGGFLDAPIEDMPQDTAENSASDPFYAIDVRALESSPLCCSCCGVTLDQVTTSVIKRGALTIQRENFAVSWRAKPIALSPTETEMLASIAARGYASFSSISAVLTNLGLSPRTRDVLLHRIRRKFQAVGAAAPFARCGNAGLRLVVEPDEQGSTATVIGLRSAPTTFVTAR
ncbi:response regulator transcription factor [Sphingomonas panacisoli]|uniref:Response regulator transcription factor n=1 Tax=Sphingomonas panacisoli TaxID=1813879 RepID=A0A5B8LKN0_9SPHN|nr:response regulator transcription factor [Sphingomonas panacisoli]QDZ08295.1 response regulator transcription factor [Sphingomonas panacisoli]